MNRNILLSAVAAGLAAMAVVVPAAMAADSGGGGGASAPDSVAAAVRASSGATGIERGAGRFAFRRGDHAGISVTEAAAAQLGMTVDELRAALTDGTSILDVTEAKGLDPEAFTAAVVAVVKASIESAVASGDLTQDQADRMLANLEEHVAAHLASTHEPGVRGKGGCDHGGSGESEDGTQDEEASTEA